MRLVVRVTACPQVEPRCSRLALRQRPPDVLLSPGISRSCALRFYRGGLRGFAWNQSDDNVGI